MSTTTTHSDVEAEAVEHAPVHRCIVRGETSDGGPFQRIYVTYSADEADRFNSLMGLIEKEQGLTKGDIGKIIDDEFPSLILILEQHGNEITEDVPESLPVGEGYWDEHDHVQLLRRALMATENEWKDSIRKAGNEMASNMPTLLAIGIKGDAGYWFAGACGLGIAGAIGYRGYRQNKRFNRTLEIFVEFMNNRSVNPDMAKDVLEKRIRSSGLLFSGIPDNDLSKFDENHYIAIADKRGLWYNKNYLTERLYRRALPNGSQRVEVSPESVSNFSRKALKTSGHFLLEQGADFFNNPFNPQTWRNIGKGSVDLCILVYEFRNTVSRNRAYQDMVKAHPEFEAIKIEEHDHVHDAADHNILQEIKVTKADLGEQKRDGMIMGAAFTMEAGFMGAHAYEVAHAGHTLFEENFSDAVHADHSHESWIDTPEAAVGLGIYSIFMASGAFAYLGREIASIKDTLQSRRARVLNELYPQAMEQYREYQEQRAEAATPEAGVQ